MNETKNIYNKYYLKTKDNKIIESINSIKKEFDLRNDNEALKYLVYKGHRYIVLEKRLKLDNNEN